MVERGEEERMVRKFEPSEETERIVEWLRETNRRRLRRDGGVVGVSGGVDSATVLYLMVRAFGAKRVVMLILPDRDSSGVSARLALELGERLGVETKQEDLTGVLQASGCYRLRDGAVGHAVPGFDAEHDKAKIVLPENLLGEGTLNIFSVVVVKPDGREERSRLSVEELRQIVGASNMKQRARMSRLYYEAESRNYSVVGTANKNEHELGFFVKYGDGGADLCPIRHLLKTQVYELAEYVGVPLGIRERAPTTDTYSAECTQEEFFYRIPFEVLDRIWEWSESGGKPEEIAKGVGLDRKQVENVLGDIRRKKSTTEYLRLEPLGLDGSWRAGETSKEKSRQAVEEERCRR